MKIYKRVIALSLVLSIFCTNSMTTFAQIIEEERTKKETTEHAREIFEYPNANVYSDEKSQSSQTQEEVSAESGDLQKTTDIVESSSDNEETTVTGSDTPAAQEDAKEESKEEVQQEQKDEVKEETSTDTKNMTTDNSGNENKDGVSEEVQKQDSENSENIKETEKQQEVATKIESEES